MDKRIQGEKTILIFWVSHLWNSLWLSSSLRARLRPVTSEKFSKHGFSFFHQILPFSLESWLKWYFGYLVYKTMHLSSNNYFEFKWEKILSHEEELVFEKIFSVESILCQFFIQFWFSCVILTDQIFMSFLFQIESRYLDMI